jgi:xylulokinase
MKYAIACDLGTGGCKSSLYDSQGNCLDGLFLEYPTYYPAESMHEQKPEEWWTAVKQSIKGLLADKSEELKSSVIGIGLSGHSLGMVALDASGQLLLESVPIWSDSRPGKAELQPFFDKVSEEQWYTLTGNGFPPPLYTVFKILWMKNNQPESFKNCTKVIGTKDYINYRLCGVIATDYSYASGSGVYDLENWDYSEKLIHAAGLDSNLFPQIKASSEILGHLDPTLALELGLSSSVNIVAGGEDK